MSLLIAKLQAEKPRAKYSREQLLALVPDKEYLDGRTKQCHKDECDIVKIMARFAKTETISHLAKFEGVYADFSDFDFHEQTTRLAEGNEIFANLNAELRREFDQDPQKFFNFVNDPKNVKDLKEKLTALAEPGDQLPAELPSADLEARLAALEKPAKTAKPAVPAKPAEDA